MPCKLYEYYSCCSVFTPSLLQGSYMYLNFIQASVFTPLAPWACWALTLQRGRGSSSTASNRTGALAPALPNSMKSRFFPLTPNPARHAARVLSSEKRRPRTPSLETTPNSARIRHSSLHLRLLAPPTPGLSSNPRDDPRDNLQPKFFLSPKEKSAFCCVLMGQLRPDSGPLGP